MGYAIVTPARNEQETLPDLALSLWRQTVQPDLWVIVDDGSDDDTPEMARKIAELVPWASVTAAPRDVGSLESGAGQGRDVKALVAGVEFAGPHKFVGKLDGDLTLEADYFEQVLAAFADDPSLGISGGVCMEDDGHGWQPIVVTGDHVRGAARLYRWDCWLDVQPLEQRIGWDGIDLIRARLAGWTVTSCNARFFHKRPVGARG